MVISVHQPQYLPWLGLLDKIDKSDCFVFLDQVQYKAREFQNRNKIRTKDGWVWLTVPVMSKGASRQVISEVLVDNSTNWRKKHCSSLKTWYKGSRYFQDYFPFFEDLYSRATEKLMDINIEIMKYILKELDITTPLYFESQLGVNTARTDRIVDICKKFNARVYLSGSGGKNYLEEEKFFRAGIDLKYQAYSHPEYNQQFRGINSNFIPYISCVDLLFNEGPFSKKILREEGARNGAKYTEQEHFSCGSSSG